MIDTLAGGEVEVYVLFTYFDLTMFSRLSSGKSPTPGRWYQALFFVNVHGVLWVLFFIITILYFSMNALVPVQVSPLYFVLQVGS